MCNPKDLQIMLDEELTLLMVEAPREFERRKAKREQEFLAAVREQMTVLGISPARLRTLLTPKSGARKLPKESP